MPTHNSSSSSSSTTPYWLPEDADARSMTAASEQQRGMYLNRQGNGLPLTSLFPPHRMEDNRLGQADLGNCGSEGGYEGLMAPANGFFANSNSNQGTMSQMINTDFLNLYKALSRVGLPQNQASLPEPTFMSQPHEFSLERGLSRQISLEHQHMIPHNGQHNLGQRDLGQRGIGSEMTLNPTPMRFTNQLPNSLAQSPWYNPRHLYGDASVAHLPNFQQQLAESTSCVTSSDLVAFGKDLAASFRTDTLKDPKHPLKDPKHPLRALSAYNFFFRDERDRIVNDTEGNYETTSDKKQELLERHWYRDRTKKRRHRKTHGKIAFTELSKVISQRWKGLSQEVKSFYHDVAAEDSLRYNKEVDAQKGLQ